MAQLPSQKPSPICIERLISGRLRARVAPLHHVLRGFHRSSTMKGEAPARRIAPHGCLSPRLRNPFVAAYTRGEDDTVNREDLLSSLAPYAVVLVCAHARVKNSEISVLSLERHFLHRLCAVCVGNVVFLFGEIAGAVEFAARARLVCYGVVVPFVAAGAEVFFGVFFKV